MESGLVELTDDQLELVAGGIIGPGSVSGLPTGGTPGQSGPPPGSGSIVLDGVLQLIRQSAAIQQQGGSATALSPSRLTRSRMSSGIAGGGRHVLTASSAAPGAVSHICGWPPRCTRHLYAFTKFFALIHPVNVPGWLFPIHGRLGSLSPLTAVFNAFAAMTTRSCATTNGPRR